MNFVLYYSAEDIEFSGSLKRCVIKIGIVTYDFYPLIGGIGRHTYLLYSELKEADLLFFSPADNKLPRHVRIEFGPVRFLKQVGVSIWLHLNAAKIIAEHGLKKLNIHTGPGGVLLTRKLAVPVIVTCHHTYRQQCRHLKSQFWKRIFIPFESRTYRLADRIVAVSEATRRALIDDYGIPEEKVVKICNAIEPGRFHQIKGAKEGNTVVYLGRVDRRKGIRFLIESMPQVQARLPEVRLLVGGKGPYLEKMKRLAARLGLKESVIFLGFVPDHELNALYNKGQCVVVPSVFEGFGITIIEALASGSRVIGSDADGLREIIEGSDYGSLVPYGDVDRLAAAIVAELENPKQPGPLRPEYLSERFRVAYDQVFRGAAAR